MRLADQYSVAATDWKPRLSVAIAILAGDPSPALETSRSDACGLVFC